MSPMFQSKSPPSKNNRQIARTSKPENIKQPFSIGERIEDDNMDCNDSKTEQRFEAELNDRSNTKLRGGPDPVSYSAGDEMRAFLDTYGNGLEEYVTDKNTLAAQSKNALVKSKMSGIGCSKSIKVEHGFKSRTRLGSDWKKTDQLVKDKSKEQLLSKSKM